MNPDGWIIVGTKLDTKQLEKDLKEETRRLEQYEKEAEKLTTAKAKTDEDLSSYYEELEIIKELTDEALKQAKTKEEIDIALETEQRQVGKLNEKYFEQLQNLSDINRKIEENAKNQGLVKTQIEETTKTLQSSRALDNTKASIDNIGVSIKKTIKKIGKWALAVFGIRSAYMAVRSAMNVIASNDKQLSADIDYIKNVLAYTLEPLVRRMIEWAKQLLTYIGYISQKWFGKNIFADADKNLKKANKGAKQLQKTMAGFDEMNTIGSNENNNISSSFNVGDINSIEVPKWVQWIADNKNVILTVLGALATTFATAKVAKWIKNLSGIATVLGAGSTGILGLLTQIGIIGAGIAIIIYIAKKWWDDVNKFKKSLDEMSKKEQEFHQKWIEKENDINKLIITGNVNRNAGYQTLKDSQGVLAKITGLDQQLIEQAKLISENIQKQIDKEYELYKTTELTKDEKQKILDNIMHQVEYNKEVIEALKEQGQETSDLEEMNKTLAKYGNDIYKNIHNTDQDLYNINKMELKDKNLKVKIDADTTKAENKTSSWLKGLAKSLLTLGLQGYGLTGYITSKTIGKLFNAKGAIYIPKLASGGIINQPGRGVPLGSAFGGERGAEGVIPLTDSQQMALLGEAIGKYITINATVVNSMNGRVLSREIQKIQNQSDFLMNR